MSIWGDGSSRAMSQRKTHPCTTPVHAAVLMRNAARVHLWSCVGVVSCYTCVFSTFEPVHFRLFVNRLTEQPCHSFPLYARPGTAMEETPRVAFGHLDQDGCQEEGALTVHVAVVYVSGDQLCNLALKEEDQVQRLKTQISSALGVPECDQNCC